MNNDISDKEYIIVGDTDKHKDCLIYICGTYENAKRCLNRMLNNPNYNDIKIMDNHTNFRIKEVLSKDCWWNYGTD